MHASLYTFCINTIRKSILINQCNFLRISFINLFIRIYFFVGDLWFDYVFGRYMRVLLVVVPLSLVILKCIITCHCLVMGTATLTALICLMQYLIVLSLIKCLKCIVHFLCFLYSCPDFVRVLFMLYCVRGAGGGGLRFDRSKETSLTT